MGADLQAGTMRLFEKAELGESIQVEVRVDHGPLGLSVQSTAIE
jgi:hypothetical protein